MEWIDTHTHLNSQQLENDVPAILQRAAEVGVTSVLCIGIDVASSHQAVEIAQRHAAVHAVVGIQPNYCRDLDDADFQEIVSLARQPRVVGIGETGLDLYWDDCPLDTQKEFFRRHIQLARELDLPFVVHMRDCQTETMELIDEFRNAFPLKGVMHSFTGDWEGARFFLDAGLHISFAGMVTYKKSEELRNVASQVPSDRLLVETDCPYLSPEPKRGQRPNEPALVRHTGECLAAARQVPVDQLASQTSGNARKLFGI